MGLEERRLIARTREDEEEEYLVWTKVKGCPRPFYLVHKVPSRDIL
jgi:hypothetical protein